MKEERKWKKGRKEGRKEGKKEGTKEGRKGEEREMSIHRTDAVKVTA
jgi:hypothetical protein